MTWTAEKDAILRDNFLEKSATAISEMIPGKTRNAVIGRLRRLGLKLTDSQRIAKQSVNKNRGRPVLVRLSKEENVFERKITSVPLLTLKPHHCRWPEGHGHFCGKNKDQSRWNNSAYCAEHADRAYVQSKRNSRKGRAAV